MFALQKRHAPPLGFHSPFIPIIDGKIKAFYMGKEPVRISKPLSAFKVPELQLTLANGKAYPACIDTGSYYSQVSPFILSELGLRDSIQTVIGENPNFGKYQTQVFDLTFTIEDFTFLFEDMFCVLATNYQYPIILGSRFLAECKEFHYYGRENRFDLVIGQNENIMPDVEI